MTKVYNRLTDDLPINSVVTEVVVDDPLEPGAKLRVRQSIRDDPLAEMLARGQVDQAMYAAGRQWQCYHEHSEIGGVSAIDPRKEAVDGGQMPELLTERHIKAIRELTAARQRLGEFGMSLISDVLDRRMSIKEIAAHRSMTRARELDFLSRRFRECLETLAGLWGFRT